MDQILAKASSQVVSFAIRSGITLASGYAIKTVSRFLDKIPVADKSRIDALRSRLKAKIGIVSGCIDLIRLAAARGNSSLDQALDLAADLSLSIDTFNEAIGQISAGMTQSNEKQSIERVEKIMANLISNINDIVPLLHLAIVSSGVSLSHSVSMDTISPGRFIQASYYLQAFNLNSSLKCVGPEFDLVTYSVFYNPTRLKYVHHEVDVSSCILWKETFARALVQVKTRNSGEFDIEILESFDDGRYHDVNEETPQVLLFDVSTIQRLFFSASGKLLSLEERSSPVLIIKFGDEGSDEWLALGELKKGEFEEEQSLDESVDDSDVKQDYPTKDQAPKVTTKGALSISSQLGDSSVPSRQTSLSLLEYILRLCRLQQIEGKSILEVKDEVLALYLHDEPCGGWDALPEKFDVAKERTKQDKTRNTVDTNTKLTMASNMKRLQNLNL